MLILPAPRILTRAPRGGVVSPVNGKFYRGGWFMPTPRPVAGHALTFDVTRDDLDVVITNPATGGSRTFRIATADDGAFAGKRVAMILDGSDPSNRWDWIGFGFVDSFGITPWRRYATDKRIAGPSGYIALLTESARFAARGVAYQIAN